MVLSKIEQFGNVTVNKEDGVEKIDLIYTEKIGEMSFTLKLNASLRVFTEEEQEQIIDDNLDFFEMDDNDDDVSDENGFDENDFYEHDFYGYNSD
jgi:hypothetical protein